MPDIVITSNVPNWNLQKNWLPLDNCHWWRNLQNIYTLECIYATEKWDTWKGTNIQLNMKEYFRVWHRCTTGRENAFDCSACMLDLFYILRFLIMSLRLLRVGNSSDMMVTLSWICLWQSTHFRLHGVHTSPSIPYILTGDARHLVNRPAPTLQLRALHCLIPSQDPRWCHKTACNHQKG